jgi:hypothetical protein
VKVLKMAKSDMSTSLDLDLLRAYEAAGPEEKRKLQASLQNWLREQAASIPSVGRTNG